MTSTQSWYAKLSSQDKRRCYQGMQRNLYDNFVTFSEYATFSGYENKRVVKSLYFLLSDAIAALAKDKCMSNRISYILWKLCLTYHEVPLDAFPTLECDSCCIYGIINLMNEVTPKNPEAPKNKLRIISDFYQMNYSAESFPGNDKWVRHVAKSTNALIICFLQFFKVSFEAKIKSCNGAQKRKRKSGFSSLACQLEDLRKMKVEFRDSVQIRAHAPKNLISSCCLNLSRMPIIKENNQKDNVMIISHNYKTVKTSVIQIRPHLLKALFSIKLLTSEVRSKSKMEEIKEEIRKGWQPQLYERTVALFFERNVNEAPVQLLLPQKHSPGLILEELGPICYLSTDHVDEKFTRPYPCTNQITTEASSPPNRCAKQVKPISIQPSISEKPVTASLSRPNIQKLLHELIPPRKPKNLLTEITLSSSPPDVDSNNVQQPAAIEDRNLHSFNRSKDRSSTSQSSEQGPPQNELQRFNPPIKHPQDMSFKPLPGSNGIFPDPASLPFMLHSMGLPLHILSILSGFGNKPIPGNLHHNVDQPQLGKTPDQQNVSAGVNSSRDSERKVTNQKPLPMQPEDCSQKSLSRQEKNSLLVHQSHVSGPTLSQRLSQNLEKLTSLDHFKQEIHGPQRRRPPQRNSHNVAVLNKKMPLPGQNNLKTDGIANRASGSEEIVANGNRSTSLQPPVRRYIRKVPQNTLFANGNSLIDHHRQKTGPAHVLTPTQSLRHSKPSENGEIVTNGNHRSMSLQPPRKRFRPNDPHDARIENHNTPMLDKQRQKQIQPPRLIPPKEICQPTAGNRKIPLTANHSPVVGRPLRSTSPIRIAHNVLTQNGKMSSKNSHSPMISQPPRLMFPENLLQLRPYGSGIMSPPYNPERETSQPPLKKPSQDVPQKKPTANVVMTSSLDHRPVTVKSPRESTSQSYLKNVPAVNERIKSPDNHRNVSNQPASTMLFRKNMPEKEKLSDNRRFVMKQTMGSAESQNIRRTILYRNKSLRPPDDLNQSNDRPPPRTTPQNVPLNVQFGDEIIPLRGIQRQVASQQPPSLSAQDCPQSDPSANREIIANETRRPVIVQPMGQSCPQNTPSGTGNPLIPHELYGKADLQNETLQCHPPNTTSKNKVAVDNGKHRLITLSSPGQGLPLNVSQDVLSQNKDTTANGKRHPVMVKLPLPTSQFGNKTIPRGAIQRQEANRALFPSDPRLATQSTLLQNDEIGQLHHDTDQESRSNPPQGHVQSKPAEYAEYKMIMKDGSPRLVSVQPPGQMTPQGRPQNVFVRNAIVPKRGDQQRMMSEPPPPVVVEKVSQNTSSKNKEVTVSDDLQKNDQPLCKKLVQNNFNRMPSGNGNSALLNNRGDHAYMAPLKKQSQLPNGNLPMKKNEQTNQRSSQKIPTDTPADNRLIPTFDSQRPGTSQPLGSMPPQRTSVQTSLSRKRKLPENGTDVVDQQDVVSPPPRKKLLQNDAQCTITGSLQNVANGNQRPITLQSNGQNPSQCVPGNTSSTNGKTTFFDDSEQTTTSSSLSTPNSDLCQTKSSGNGRIDPNGNKGSMTLHPKGQRQPQNVPRNTSLANGKTLLPEDYQQTTSSSFLPTQTQKRCQTKTSGNGEIVPNGKKRSIALQAKGQTPSQSVSQNAMSANGNSPLSDYYQLRHGWLSHITSNLGQSKPPGSEVVISNPNHCPISLPSKNQRASESESLSQNTSSINGKTPLFEDLRQTTGSVPTPTQNLCEIKKKNKAALRTVNQRPMTLQSKDQMIYQSVPQNKSSPNRKRTSSNDHQHTNMLSSLPTPIPNLHQSQPSGSGEVLPNRKRRIPYYETPFYQEPPRQPDTIEFLDGVVVINGKHCPIYPDRPAENNIRSIPQNVSPEKETTSFFDILSGQSPQPVHMCEQNNDTSNKTSENETNTVKEDDRQVTPPPQVQNLIQSVPAPVEASHQTPSTVKADPPRQIVHQNITLNTPSESAKTSLPDVDRFKLFQTTSRQKPLSMILRAEETQAPARRINRVLNWRQEGFTPETTLGDYVRQIFSFDRRSNSPGNFNTSAPEPQRATLANSDPHTVSK